MVATIDALVLGGNTFRFHRLDRLGPVLADRLAEAGVAAEVTTDRDALLSGSVAAFDVVVDLTTDSRFTDDQLDGLVSFVEDGGGYAGVHAAADLTTTADGGRQTPQPDLRALLGGHFVGHPAQSRFEVTIVDSHHPVTADLNGFAVWDEPYELEVDDDVRVLARMDHPELGDMPVAWVRPVGDGRVFYCSLGHDDPAYAVDGFARLLGNGVRWAADGPPAGD